MELTYTIRRSPKRKKLTITVERDRSVIVHAPESASEGRIREAIESRKRWIYEKLRHTQKYSELPHPPGKEMVNGESALYLGRHYQIAITDGGDGEIEFDRKFLVPASRSGDEKTALREWYKAKARETILPRVARFAKELGVEPAAAKIVDSRYRWGSCTAGDNVTLNWRLIKAPMYVVDYVIVHELAHLLEGNHTPRFWNIVRAQLPRMEKAKQWLREHGELLEDDI